MIGDGIISVEVSDVLTAGGVSEADMLLDRVNLLRLATSLQLDKHRKAELGQYFTPAPIAEFRASLAKMESSEIHILDAGAGVGSLFAAAVATLMRRAVL